MNENMTRAKEIFLKYAGDPYQMECEGELDGYRALGVTKTEEEVWAKEYEKTLIDHFYQAGVVDSSVITFMKFVKRFESTEELLAFLSAVERQAKSLDTFTKLRLCEEVLETVSFFEKQGDTDEDALRRGRGVALDLVQLAEREPITVNPYYRTVPHLPETFEDSRLYQRISRLVMRST